MLEAIYIAGPVLIVAGIGGLHLDPRGRAGLRRLRADRDRDVRAHARLARVAPRARPGARARGRARLPRRADPARHDGRASASASASSRSRCPRCASAPARPAPPASCSACGASAAWSAASSRAACAAGRDPGRRVIVLLAALAGGTLPLVLASDVVSLGALIFLAGIAIAPALAAVHSLTGPARGRAARSPRPTRGSAPAWARGSRSAPRSAARWSRESGTRQAFALVRRPPSGSAAALAAPAGGASAPSPDAADYAPLNSTPLE